MTLDTCTHCGSTGKLRASEINGMTWYECQDCLNGGWDKAGSGAGQKDDSNLTSPTLGKGLGVILHTYTPPVNFIIFL